MAILYVLAFLLASIAQIRAKGQDLVAWAVMALSIIQAIAFFRGL